MSGFVALFDRNQGGVQRENLYDMLGSIPHRGPDGSDSWCGSKAALGHQQLQTTPESRFDTQPYREGSLVIAGDVRIDNREEILEAVSATEPWNRIPDSQLVLAAYRKWGRQSPEYLLGSFAFVIYDQENELVFAARDRFGIKPLYYHESTDRFAAASEMKALLTLPFVSGILNEVKIGDFLVGRFGDKASTYYQDIVRLQPAHALICSRDQIHVWQYWDLDPKRTIHLESNHAYERRFRELFEQAVSCRLRSIGPVGTTLSGGIDSSSVTVVARDLLPPEQPLHTYSWITDDAPSSDEREYMEAVTDRDGIISHYVPLDGVSTFKDAEEVFRACDMPPFNPLYFSRWEISERADQVGTNVLLNGNLGDSSVGYGLRLLPDLFRRGRWRHLFRELECLSERAERPLRDAFFRLVLLPLVPDPLKRYYQQFQDVPVLEAGRNHTLNPEFVERIDLRSRYKKMYEDRSLLGRTARENQYEALTLGLLVTENENLDHTSAWYGLEQRDPFTDKRLVEFSLAIPPSQQLHNGWTRSIIRRSLGDLLPEKIQWRSGKTTTNELSWQALSLEADRLESLLEYPGPLAQYVDIERLRDSYQRFCRDPNTKDGRALWKALSLWMWFRLSKRGSTSD